jgi:poly-gamma-glutamate capsule biosynthesis protein CapA/YwtB (metallophosphatase superfamily)
VLCAGCSGHAELWLGGDVHLGASTGPLVAGVCSLDGAVGIVNLEGPIGPGAAASSAERLVNDPASLRILVDAGVRVVGTANNHSFDLGEGGLAATRKTLTDHGFAATPTRFRMGGVRVSVTAHDLTGEMPGTSAGGTSAGTSAGTFAGTAGEVPGTFAGSTLAGTFSRTLAMDLAEAAHGADLLVATFHVTGPPSYLPRPELREAVEIALAAGARVVASHGTHTVAAVERRGDAVIAWGLGNLSFDCNCTTEREGLILRVSAPRRGRVEAAIVPIDAGLSGRTATPASDPGLAFGLQEALGASPCRIDACRCTF